MLVRCTCTCSMATQNMCRTVKILKSCQTSLIYGLRTGYTCSTIRNPYCHQRFMSNDTADTDNEEDIIDKLRDVSRMPAHISCQMKHRAKAPPNDNRFFFMRSKNYKRRLYAKFGEESGIDPGILLQLKQKGSSCRDLCMVTDCRSISIVTYITDLSSPYCFYCNSADSCHQ